jgi:hypothetical protein
MPLCPWRMRCGRCDQILDTNPDTYRDTTKIQRTQKRLNSLRTLRVPIPIAIGTIGTLRSCGYHPVPIAIGTDGGCRRDNRRGRKETWLSPDSYREQSILQVCPIPTPLKISMCSTHFALLFFPAPDHLHKISDSVFVHTLLNRLFHLPIQ